jgi:predicted glycosyltransferase
MPDSSPSLLTRCYYMAKPYLPRSIRWAMRRHRAISIRQRHAVTWPIDESVARTPVGWPGWPEGKLAAFVLTHDVEGPAGVEKVRSLAELEMRCGFRSCFNFIPEGSYRVSDELRNWLTDNGFEVGVHDLNHDGKLYHSRSGFEQKARRINGYLRDWNATGFRSGFMLRELVWLHDLEIAYDCSTFDTDPFEPQPGGAHTIFPYWIANPNGAAGEGYVELPYTLPQDSTLYLLLRESDGGIWEKKTRWIVGHGGMVLMNVHPDYMDFQNAGDEMTFPAARYEEFLRHTAAEFGANLWCVLPREISNFVGGHRPRQSASAKWPAKPADNSISGFKIWIDLENTPHIPFFRPIVRELQRRGHQVVLTARDAYQTCEIAKFHGIEFQRIGRHRGKNLAAKAVGLVTRSGQLYGYARDEKPQLALNLGSRSQNVAAKLLGIPVVEIMDYEHTAEPRLLASRWYFMPEVVQAAVAERKNDSRVRAYRGIKEDVYVPDFVPDLEILDLLDLRGAKVVMTVRPSATEAHYHNPEAEELFDRVMERALAISGVKVVLLPRNKRQETHLRGAHPDWFVSPQVIVPPQVVDGLNLIWHSDLVVSGGGTMNREAAAMGVPVYSIFRGRTGAVDKSLADQGRLVFITSAADVESKIQIEPRPIRSLPDPRRSDALADILGHLDKVLSSLASSHARTVVPSLAADFHS